MSKNESDDAPDLDAEWQELERSSQGDRPAVSEGRGPRDWTPEPEDDEFDPQDLPVAEPGAPAANWQAAKSMFLVAAVCFALLLANLFDFSDLGSTATIMFGVGAVLALAGGIYAAAPWAHRPDDDGARL